MKIRKLLKRLKTERLYTIPSMLLELLRISRDPLAAAEDLAVMCEKDPTISARLLRTANSAYFGRAGGARVDTVTDAIVRLGFRRAQEAIMSATVCAALVTKHSSSDFSMWELWRHSYAVGICNRMISMRSLGKLDVDPFLAGLLHDIGIIIENQCYHDAGFFEVTEARRRNQSLLTQEERIVLGMTHEEIGEAVAREWNFPEHITAVLGHHHNMEVEDQRIRRLLHITRISEWICFVLKLGYFDFSAPYADELMQSRSKLPLTDEDIEAVGQALEREMKELHGLGWFPYTSYRAT